MSGVSLSYKKIILTNIDQFIEEDTLR